MVMFLNILSIVFIVLAYKNIETRRGTQLFLCSSITFFFLFLALGNYPQVLLNVFTGYMAIKALYPKSKEII